MKILPYVCMILYFVSKKYIEIPHFKESCDEGIYTMEQLTKNTSVTKACLMCSFEPHKEAFDIGYEVGCAVGCACYEFKSKKLNFDIEC